eukprot:6198436-Pyramimonas_sp.AAC.2
MAKGKSRKKSTKGKEAPLLPKDPVVSSASPSNPHDEFLANAGVYDHGHGNSFSFSVLKGVCYETP